MRKEQMSRHLIHRERPVIPKLKAKSLNGRKTRNESGLKCRNERPDPSGARAGRLGTPRHGLVHRPHDARIIY